AGGEIVTIELPDAMIKHWWDLKPEFKQFVEDFRSRNPLAKDFVVKKGAGPGSKDGGGTAPSVKNPKKRAAEKDLSGCIVEVKDAPGTRILEVPLVNARMATRSDSLPTLVISDMGPMILNETSVAATLASGAILCGWGKGKFREGGKDKAAFNEDKDILFAPSAATIGVVDNVAKTFEEILDNARMTKGLDQCKVCYHKATVNPEGKWELEKVNDVIFGAVDEEASLKWSQSQAAKKISPKKWDTEVSAVGWQLKWSINGLQPLRPIVIAKQDLTVEAGKALVLQ
ncbi:unnamed protein product, partial [Symbiodinium sp. CCMP2592]